MAEPKGPKISTMSGSSTGLNYSTISIVISLLIVLITIAYFLLKKRSSPDSILLIGRSGSGKTTLFSQLTYKKFSSTVTSMKENEAQIKLKENTSLNLIDLPGFDRLRNQFWDKFKDRAKCIIYVLDSLNFMTNMANEADLLYQYLCDDVVVSNRTPILIACTKQDETRAKSSKVISTMLEKELNTIRETRLGALDTTSKEDNNASTQILGDPNKPFKFNDLKNNLKFVDCSVSKDNINIENILQSINTMI